MKNKPSITYKSKALHKANVMHRALEILMDGQIGNAVIFDEYNNLRKQPQSEWARIIVASATKKAYEIALHGA